MPTLKDEYARMQFLMSKGHGDERCTPVVLVEQEAKQRIANNGDKPKTRFTFETDSPQAYSDLNAEKDRYLRVIENKVVAIQIFISALRAYDDEQLREMAEGNHD